MGIAVMGSGKTPLAEQLQEQTQKPVGLSLGELDSLAAEIASSQKFGQPLPLDTTARWASRIRALTAAIRGRLRQPQ